MRSAVLVVLVVMLPTVFPANADAQPNRQYWGVDVSFAPDWHVNDWMKKLFDADALDVSGSEFTVGFVRGQTRQGDWGVSYVHKSVKNGSRVLTSDVERIASDVAVNGVTVHKFAPFTTIKDRVQIGMLFGAGVGSPTGNATERDLLTGTIVPIEARRFFSPFGQDIPVVPLGEVEVAVAVIAAPGFKVRASGGFNYPGTTAFTIGAVYLFGER